MKIKSTLLALAVLLPITISAQQSIRLHSHNDYTRTVPFWDAYNHHCNSIEADIYWQEGQLLVGHNLEDLKPEKTFLRMYVEPIVKTFRANGNRMWNDSGDRLMLLIDLKTPTEPTLSELIKLLEQYPDVFCTPNGVMITITGNVPENERFQDYPAWVAFDGDLRKSYTPAQLERVPLVSNYVRLFAEKWDGYGQMTNSELDAVKDAIEKAHSWGKPIRFWGAPESNTVYITFWRLGVDFINTDKPAASSNFFSDLKDKKFVID